MAKNVASRKTINKQTPHTRAGVLKLTHRLGLRVLWVPRYGSALQPVQGRRVGHKKATKHHGVSSGGVISAAADPIDGFLRSRDAEFSAKFHDTSSSSGTA